MKTRKMLLFLMSALFLCALTGVAAAERPDAAISSPAVEWSYVFGRGEGHFVEQTKDGGLILTGWIDSGEANSDVFLAKYDGGGSNLWLQTFSGNGFNDSHCVREVRGGGYIVAAETKSKDADDHDIYVVRTDGKGALLWEKVFGGPRCDYAWSVQQTKDGGFIMAGGTESFGAGIYDVYLVKLDSSGDLIWEKTYGGAVSDCGYSLLQLADGGFLIAGNTESFGAGNTDVYLLRIDAGGEMIWQKTYGGSGSDYGWALAAAPDGGGYIIAGEKEMAGEQGAIFTTYLLQVDPDGSLLWENTYGNGRAGSFYGACRVGDGYVLTGKIESAGGYDLYVVKTAGDGSLIWEKTIDGDGAGCGYAVAQVRGGGLVVAGKKGIEKSAGSEILMLKLAGGGWTSRAYTWSVGLAVGVFALVLIVFRVFSSRNDAKS
ncbi:MAG: hypothetical protein PHY77_00870 [Desulfotomaculaceae bacterium]|nr:hypothetical protein [Desulfotomaculaceae bacterium]